MIVKPLIVICTLALAPHGLTDAPRLLSVAFAMTCPARPFPTPSTDTMTWLHAAKLLFAARCLFRWRLTCNVNSRTPRVTPETSRP